MLNNVKQQIFPVYQSVVLILVAVLPFSRAIISIATGLMFVLALLEFFTNKPKTNFKNAYFLILFALVLFNVLDGLRVYDFKEWILTLESKLPLLIIPFSLMVFVEKIRDSFIELICTIFGLSFTVTTLASIGNYLLHFEEINAMVLQSKNVPIIGGMHHITFSVFGALAVFISAKLAMSTGKKWLWVFAFINFIGLHILTARTGLVGFYFSMAVVGLHYMISNKIKIKWLVTGIFLLILIPITAFYTIESFHNRVLNTQEDLNVIIHQKDANYQSMGMRVEAARTAIDLFKKQPIIGVGYCNIKHEMAIQYEANASNLFIENRILPHNQFIMEAAVHGIIGLTLLILFFVLPLLQSFAKLPIIFVFLWALVFFACMFECLFDRQHGIIIIGLFWILFENYFPKNQKMRKELQV